MNSTKVLEQVESAQLGLGIIRSLIGIDADEVQNAAVKTYMDGNMKQWQSRSGLEVTGIPEPEDGDMGHTVSIGNTYHNHYEGGQPDPNPVTPPTPDPGAVQPQPPPVTPPSKQPTSNWTKAGIAAAVVLSGAALGYTLLKPDATGTDRDTDTSVSVSIPEEDRTQ